VFHETVHGPLHTVVEWLRTNGIDPADVPVDSDISIEPEPLGGDRRIRYSALLRNELGCRRRRPRSCVATPRAIGRSTSTHSNATSPGAEKPDDAGRGRPAPASLCLTCVTLGVFSPARLASRMPRMADCRGCSVECRCCAPPAGRTGSESHSTRRPNCRKAALERTYGNLPGSVSGVQTRRPVGVQPPVQRLSLGLGRVPRQGKSTRGYLCQQERDTPDRVGRRQGTRTPGFQSVKRD
jgi:hypothetical protein